MPGAYQGRNSKKKIKSTPSQESECEQMDTDEHEGGETASDSLQQLLSHLGSFNEALGGSMSTVT